MTAATGVCRELGWNKSCIDIQGRLSTVLFHGQSGHGIVQPATDLGHLKSIYYIPTQEKHQWLLLQFIDRLNTVLFHDRIGNAAKK